MKLIKILLEIIDSEVIPVKIYELVKSGTKLSPKQENVLSKNPEYSFKYAKNILKGPWQKGEDAIAKDTVYSYEYAVDVLNGPFLKGEDAIAKDPVHAYLYARDVLKGPFKKGEAVLATHPRLNREYKTLLRKL